MSKKQISKAANISANSLSSNSSVLLNLKQRRRETPSLDALFEKILKGDLTSLSRGITLIESAKKKHKLEAERLIKKSLKFSNNALRIGITGVPGVGKSTFIEALGKYLTHKGHRVAVLTIDPSSTKSKGSILGDKTRMESLAKNPNAFIRPSAAGSSLGGVTRKTRESIILCEAAGFDIILVETVGVGQSETVVHSMVDFFLLLKLAGAGDQLQGIKRGIIEIADAIIINKADGNNLKKAKTAETDFQRALHLYPMSDSGWQPKVLLCSAINNKGIDEIWELIQSYFNTTKKTGYFKQQRALQQHDWLLQIIENKLKNDFFNNQTIKKKLADLLQLVTSYQISPFEAAEQLFDLKAKL